MSLKNRYAALPEEVTHVFANSKYKKFVTACTAAGSECIQPKTRSKKSNSCESIEVGKMDKEVQEAAKANSATPSHKNKAKLKEAQAQLTATYDKEQTEPKSTPSRRKLATKSKLLYGKQ